MLKVIENEFHRFPLRVYRTRDDGNFDFELMIQ